MTTNLISTIKYYNQISSLEANLSLEDMKKLCIDGGHIHTGIPPTPQN